MTHRDQLRLAIEMQNGIVDKFVADRMARIDSFRNARSDCTLLAMWHSFGEGVSPQTGWKFLDDHIYSPADAAQVREAWHRLSVLARSAPVSDS